MFISCPGDVQAEASQIPAIATELNRTIGRKFDVFIEPASWKTHCYPGMGRAQGIINELIGPYDIFLGVMWNRFGTPTGEADSGTEEEFRIAYSEWERDHSLPILFYISTAPATFTTEDQINQRLKVIKFIDELKAKGLPWEYQSATEFSEIVRPHLSQLILDRFVRPQPTDELAASSHEEGRGTTLEQGVSGLSRDTRESSADSMLLEAFTSLVGQLQNPDHSKSIETLYGLDQFQIVRGYLLTTTLMSSLSPSTTLGSQETNQLYAYREKLAASPQERLLLFRAILKDDNDVIPGWYWLWWLEDELMRDALFERALDDLTPSIRVRAWEMLTATKLAPPVDEEARLEMISRGLSDSYELARRAVATYLGAVGGEKDLQILEAALKDDRSTLVRQEALVSRLLILARYKPDQVLTGSLPELQSDKYKICEELRVNVEKVDDEILLSVKDIEFEGVRLLVLEELIKRGLLTKEAAASMTEDSSGKVAQLVYKFLADRGEKLDPSEIYRNVDDETQYLQFSPPLAYMRPPYADRQALVLRAIQDYPEEQLSKLSQWESDIGHVAYRALALYHFSSFEARIKSDLEAEFGESASRHYEAAVNTWKDFYSSPTGIAFRQFSGLSRYRWPPSGKGDQHTPEAAAQRETETKTSKYIAAALAGIAKNGSVKDIEFGRKYLSSSDYDVRVESVRIIERLGTETDVPRLIDIAKSTDGILMKLAARTALSKASDLIEVTRTLILTRQNNLVIKVTDILVSMKADDDILFLIESFLHDKNDTVRKQAVRFFYHKYSREQLIDLLKRYMARLPYYLDVVCWLDRILYAPEVVRALFIQQLQSE